MDDETGGKKVPDRPNKEASLLALQSKYGDAERALAVLWGENYDLREERRKLQDQVDAAQNKLPEGALVLKADDAKAWKAYQELGEPSAVKDKLTKAEKLEKDLVKRAQEDAMTAAAKAAGYKPETLKELKGVDSLTFEVREEKEDGETVQVAYVKGSEEGARAKKLTDYAQEHWEPFLPALQAGEEQQQPQRSMGPTRPWPKQQQGPPPKTGPATHEEIVERKLKTDIDYVGVV